MTVAPYDPTTAVGQVRLLVFDTDIANATFSDEEITALLGLNASDIRLSSAQAVDIIAANEAYTQKVLKTLDVQTNGAKTANALFDYAKELRRQAYEGSGDMVGFFDWAEATNDEFSIRERIIKQWFRTSF